MTKSTTMTSDTKTNEAPPTLTKMGGIHAIEWPNFTRFTFTFAHCCIPFAIWELYKLGASGHYFRLIAVLLVGFAYEIFGGLGITAGAHRLWAHKTYKCKPLFEFILMLFNCIAFQGEILFWSRDHRVHHKYSDTEADPHNANRGFWFSHMGWLYLKRTNECIKALNEVPINDLLNNKIVMFQWKYMLYLGIIFRYIIPTLIGYYITGNWLIGFFFNANMMWCQSLHHTFLVNSAAHLPSWGYQPYDPDIYPSENMAVVYAAMGEGHHNFHHTFPQDYATSEMDYTDTFNPTKAFIDLGAHWGQVTSRTRVLYNPKKNNWKVQKFKDHEKAQ